MPFFSSRIHKILLTGIACAALIAILPLQQSINYSRVTEDITERLVVMPGEFITVFILGGFRGIAVDILWLKMDEYWHHGEWYRVMPILRIITWLHNFNRERSKKNTWRWFMVR